MNETEIKTKLDELANLRAAVDYITLQKQEVIDTILTDEIKAKLADITAEFGNKSEDATAKANALEAEIKAAVVQHGATVKGAFYMAKWVKGRAGSYDTTALDGYAAAHPEIKAFKKPDGEPSCSLVKV
jgi:hypothetical protein